MKASTVFLARIPDGKGNFPFVPVEIKRDRPVEPEGATAYYARYSGVRKDGSRGRVVQPLGDNIETAYAAFLNVDLAQKQIRAGQTPTVYAEPAIPAEEVSLKDAIADYLKTSEDIGNDADTVGSKTRVLDSFKQICAASGVFTINALGDPKTGRKVLLAYLAWMKDNLPTTSVKGARSENTRYTRMRRLGAFLKQHGIKIKKDYRPAPTDPGLLTHAEFPKYKARVATKYSDATIDAWLAAATVDEADVIEFFLATGFRDEEAAFAEWSDINFNAATINVYAKPRTATRPWSWKPKDDESRPIDIPLSDEFIARMKARRERQRAAGSRCALIFPSGVCKPDSHLLRRVREAAKRAQLTEPVGLHKFRKTVASRIASKFGIDLAKQILGHSDIKTTQGYLAGDNADLARFRASLNANSKPAA